MLGNTTVYKDVSLLLNLHVHVSRLFGCKRELYRVVEVRCVMEALEFSR